MKYFKIYLPVFIFLFISCGEKEIDENKDFFTISPANLTLNIDAKADNIFYTVSSDKAIQVISDSPDWCKATISNVSFDNLKIEVSESKLFQSRKAIIGISNGLENKNITINQAGIEPVITVDRNSISVQYGKQELTLEVTSNVEIHFELPDWISEKSGNEWQKGKKKYEFSLSVLPDDLLYREGLVVIKPTDEHLNDYQISVAVTQKATTKVIAHRGYWQVPNYPQNSLAALQRAIDLEIYGSELDVWITKDGALLINHDPTINGINIENSTTDDLKNVRLSNGELIPTLRECLELIEKQDITKLIIEIKPHSTTTNENRAVVAVLELIKEMDIAGQVDYISFSQNICQRLIADNPKNRVAYLNGNLAPELLKSQGYWGLDYSSAILKANTGWISVAKGLGLTTNVWTVNSMPDFDQFISLGVDFITTDYPQTLKEYLLTIK